MTNINLKWSLTILTVGVGLLLYPLHKIHPDLSNIGWIFIFAGAFALLIHITQALIHEEVEEE